MPGEFSEMSVLGDTKMSLEVNVSGEFNIILDTSGVDIHIQVI